MENNTENNVASIIEENNTGNNMNNTENVGIEDNFEQLEDIISYPINNPANIHSCDFVPFHAVLNTSDIINLDSIIYNICLLCVDTNVKYIVEKNNFIFV